MVKTADPEVASQGFLSVEQFLPASLEDIQLRQALENKLFEQWLAEKIQKMTVKLQVGRLLMNL